MLSSLLLATLATQSVVLAATSASEPPESTIEPTLAAIQSAAATAVARSPVSNVKGAGFSRFYQIWLENTDYAAAAGNGDLEFLASQGIALTNYWAVTHPSEPNYAASVGGDIFGMDNDEFHAIPKNISTVVDLLDTKGIAWGEYQEDIPYPGFQGFNYSNQQTFNNSYVRKHNPLMLYESVTSNSTRLSLIKGFDAFHSDVVNKTLPQWAFITPNMTNDAHDSNIGVASTWARNFLTPLLNNSYFMNDTLILITFDEVETYTSGNKVYSILLGGAIPTELHGTTDNTFYNHYSTISTVSVNWGLPSLGRWDCEANVFEIVANKTGYKNVQVDTTHLYFNSSYPGPLSGKLYVPVWPAPLTKASCASGKGVLSSVVSTWNGTTPIYNYTNVYPYDAADNNNNGGTPTTGGSLSSSGTTSSGSTSASGSSGSGTASSASSKALAATHVPALGVAGVAGVAGALVAAMI
ncbi:hypothetical protein, variant [Verruconis gallopava]|uniref:acid phosphatase n=1 Tax=Verruconis gallopava TaxID=253628 RepID=A0A0D2A5R4_9PEZI|nr:uncharacterized protein PV09_06728 [Verruconis gallopava]XP_016211750.1 hypothetical protein, variant [Verruconis gallopava]KIW01880.1 hypothetical protein PV09_06728 [Verruconis gallopava]KIW01881.1 hypothetical protein, variant [Verruconis gallopava]